MNGERKLKLLVLGATRHTGFHFMRQAFEAGHEVTAIIRNPDLFTYKHPFLKVVKGDALQLNTFEGEVNGKDAVISSLGNTESFKPTELCSQGVKNMLAAMQKSGVKRIICVSASAIETNPEMNFFISTASRVLQWLLKYPYADLRLMEAALKSSNANWTIIRPPRLNDNPLTGKYRVSVGGHLRGAFSINRADLAHYMLQHILDETTWNKIIEIAY